MGMTYTTSSKRKRQDEQATVRIVAVKNELLVFATNTDIKPKAIRMMFREVGHRDFFTG